MHTLKAGSYLHCPSKKQPFPWPALLPPLYQVIWPYSEWDGEPLRLNTTLLHGQPDFQFPASIHHMATERLTPAKGREGVVQEEKASSFSSGVCCPHFVGSSSNSESSSPVLPTQGIYQRHLLAQAVHCMAAASLDCFCTSP